MGTSDFDLRTPRIRVVGCGGAGTNSVHRLASSGLRGVHTVAVNTDKDHLARTTCTQRVLLGDGAVRGTGGRPEIGARLAQMHEKDVRAAACGGDLTFVIAGLGGGTGTGSTPIIANLASEMDILVIAIVTLPFEFEGRVRAKQAEDGLNDLKSAVDTVIAIPNERLLQTVNLNTSIQDAFRMADDILRQAAQGISDLITKPGLINLDFADVKSVMKGMGVAFMGTGLASGENRALDAAQKAISSPLLVDTSIEGAHGVLINITGGKDMTLHEVSKASQLIHSLADPEANIIFGTVIDESMKDTVKVTVIATGFDESPVKALGPAEPPARTPARGKTPPPFPVHQDTPTYVFEPKSGAPAWEPGFSDRQWDSYETPSFIRRTKHSSMRKTPHDIG